MSRVNQFHIHIISDSQARQNKIVFHRIIWIKLFKTGRYLKSCAHIRMLSCCKTQFQTNFMHMSIKGNNQF